jgi:hypothetical protein
MPPAVMDFIGHATKVRSVSDYTSIQRYRHEAKRVLEAAVAARASDVREALEEIARQYELLANAIAARLRRR